MFEIFTGPTGMIMLAAAGGIMLLGLAFVTLLRGERPDPMQKFSQEARRRAASTARSESGLRRGKGRDIKALDGFSRFLVPESAQEMSAAQQRMMLAGYHGKHAVRDFAALQFILAMSGLILSLLLVFVLMPDTFDTPTTMGPMLVAPMLLGYYGPRIWIQKRVDARKEELVAGFPDALDMMLICVEAGQSLDQSIQRVSRELGTAYPALGEELGAVGEQVKAGRERSEVLKDLAKRCDITDITSFVTVMVQASTYGTSITDALRVFAAEMRDKRIMRAEEKANILPTKMTLGTMMFTVPPLLIILIAPSVVGIMTELGGGNITGGM